MAVHLRHTCCATPVAPHLSHVVGEKNDIRHELNPRFAKLKQVDDESSQPREPIPSIAKPVVHASDVLIKSKESLPRFLTKYSAAAQIKLNLVTAKRRSLFTHLFKLKTT